MFHDINNNLKTSIFCKHYQNVFGNFNSILLLMVNSYATYKMTMKFLRECSFLITCTIDNNTVLCTNKVIEKDIADQLKISKLKIKHISFFVYVETFVASTFDNKIHTLLSLPFELFPVYKKNLLLEEFIQQFKSFSTVDIKAYSTKTFEKREYNFSNPEICKTILIDKPNTNPSFSKFNQSIFHAGNQYQVDRFGIMMMNSMFQFNDEKVDPAKVKSTNVDSKKIQYDQKSIINTINYAFNYLKKGILVGIKNGKIAIFLPMSKSTFKNDYFEELYFDEEDKRKLLQLKREPNNHKLLKQTESTVKHYFNKFKLSKNKFMLADVVWDRRKWYLNGCLIRHDSYEGDKLVLLYLDFLTELCASKKINDCVFVLNTRDFPILRKDLKHPNVQVIDRKIPKEYLQPFCPILSSGTSLDHDDLPLITPDDWMRVSKRFYPDSCKNGNFEEITRVPWSNKSNKVLFRGTASGCGITVESNLRLKLIKIAKENPDLFDVGLTNFNYKMKKNLNEKIDVIDSNKFERGTFVTNEEKPTFKYILNIDGHVAAFRLGYELQVGSVILLVESRNTIWLTSLLKPYVHYVPVNSDLSNILEIIQWCKDNDLKCKTIAENALKMFEEKLTKESMFQKMEDMLNSFQMVKDKDTNDETFTAKKIGIVLCYRDNDEHTRYQELIQYIYHVTKMLEHQNTDFRLIVTEQSHGSKFNIGKIKNIGYKYLIEKEPDIDYFIFSDIDMIPNHELLPYFTKIVDGLSTMATRGTRYHTDNSLFVGGCIALTGKTFERINGFSNNYDGGWGGEDDNLVLRLLKEKVKLYIPNGTVIDMEENEKGNKKSILEKVRQEKEDNNYNMQRYEMLVNYENYKSDGLINCIYDVIHESYSNKIYQIIVDVQHEKQRESFPKHFDISGYTDEKYKQVTHYRATNTPTLISY